MNPQQQIDRAMADGFMLALTLASAKGLTADANEMIQFLADVAMGHVLARGSVEEEYQKYVKNLGREPTETERDDFFRESHDLRRLARDEDRIVATRIMRDLRATGAV